MSEFGAQLKQARESRGISLRQIATSTKISTAALEALERGDLSKLPGGIFSRAFVRAYAIEVGLDPDEIVSQFLVELGVHESQLGDDEIHPEVTADDRAFLEQQRRAALWLRVGIGVFILLIIAAVMWWKMSNGTPEPDAAVAPQASAPAPEVTQTANTPAATGPAVSDDFTPTIAVAPSTSPVWIELTTADSCWVQVTTDGRAGSGRVFAAGERQRFEATREIVLQVGNAGVVTWTVNGRPGRALGTVGEVKTVTISPATASGFFQSQAQDAHPTPTASATAHP
jgi:cytoskeleton protein RodZ